jgi:hypothetical protein
MPREKSSKRSTTKRPRAKAEEASAEVVIVPGPPKKRKLPTVRLSSHKARSRWFQTRTTWPERSSGEPAGSRAHAG